MSKYCGKCGQENTTKAKFCPYCGEKMIDSKDEKEVIIKPAAKTNGLALAGFIVSMGSTILAFWGITGLVGTILSIIGLVKTSNNRQPGRGFAIAGLIVGIISSIIGFFISIFAFAGLMESLYY